MPIYEYKCSSCSNIFEIIVLSSIDIPLECPECKDSKIEKLISSGSIRPQGIPKGSGGFNAKSCNSSLHDG